MDTSQPQLPLSPREQRIAQLLAQGWCRKEIATVLGCSVHTVWTHCRRMRQKVGARTMTECVVRWCLAQQSA